VRAVAHSACRGTRPLCRRHLRHRAGPLALSRGACQRSAAGEQSTRHRVGSRAAAAAARTRATAQSARQILDISVDQFYCFGIVLPPPGYGLGKANLRNVPPKRFAAWLFQDPAVTNTSTYFFE
jgi:hypothetical protein